MIRDQQPHAKAVGFGRQAIRWQAAESVDRELKGGCVRALDNKRTAKNIEPRALTGWSALAKGIGERGFHAVTPAAPGNDCPKSPAYAAVSLRPKAVLDSCASKWARTCARVAIPSVTAVRILPRSPSR